MRKNKNSQYLLTKNTIKGERKMKKPNLTTIENRLKQGQNFELTSEQYKNQTGADLPKRKYYIEKDSALAKLARKYEFQIEFMSLRIKFSKTVA